MNILKIYSMIIIAIALILNLLTLLKEGQKDKRISAFMSICLFIPIWYYLLKN